MSISTWYKGWVGLTVSILVCEWVGFLSGFFFVSQEFYSVLARPSFAPPASLFGPVWTALYALMGLAVWLVLRSQNTGRNIALTAFIIQLFLNTLWTPTFFGAQQLGLAFGVIVLLVLAIIWSIVSFWRVNRSAAIAMLPYLAWVLFASVLNYSIWQLNSII